MIQEYRNCLGFRYQKYQEGKEFLMKIQQDNMYRSHILCSSLFPQDSRKLKDTEYLQRLLEGNNSREDMHEALLIR